MAQLKVARHPDRARVVRAALFALLLAALLAVSSLALAQFIWPAGPGSAQEVYLSDLPDEPNATRFLSVDRIRVWAVRQPDGSVSAFWGRSTHRRCDIEYVAAGSTAFGPFAADFVATHGLPGIFFDVCSHVIWSLDGARLFGPAPRGLDSFDLQAHEDGSATIDLRRIHVGTCSSGVHFTSPPPHYCSTPEQPIYDDGPSPDAPGFPF